jgi:hypothetical protein
MRIYPLWLVVCSVSVLVTAAPASAAKRPPRPIVASHGVKVKAGYVGQCPRREQKPPCAIPDFFATTKPVPVHPGGVLRINTRRRVRRLRLDLDCEQGEVEVVGRTHWTFELPAEGCTIGELLITYRKVRVTYTFNLERHEHCQPDGSEAVAENLFARIYSVDRFVEEDDGRDLETAFFACRFDSGRSRMLGRNYCGYYSGCDYLDHPVLAGERVAYVSGFEDYRYETRRRFTLIVLDTASFSFERQFDWRTPTPDAYERDITALVLKSNGSIAWILYRVDWRSFERTYTYEVWKADSGGTVLLDSDPQIDPESLALNGSTLFWTRAGEPRSATLD